jgi:hypothetical protein
MTAVAGCSAEIFLQTNALGNHYSVSGTTSMANVYQDVFGVIDLTNDTSKKARIRLDCNTPGVNYYWDAIMVEEYLGDNTTVIPSAYGAGASNQNALSTDMLDDDGISDKHGTSGSSYNLAATSSRYTIAGPIGPIEVNAGDIVQVTGKTGDCEGDMRLYLYSSPDNSTYTQVDITYIVAGQGGFVLYPDVISVAGYRYYRLQAASDAVTDNLVEHIQLSALNIKR